MKIIQKTWQERTAELAAEGLRPIEVTKIIESEFGGNMYNKVQKYMQKYCKKNETPATKHIALQNLEPKDYTQDWDGNHVVRFGLMGDTQLGSKYAQITQLHKYYDICRNLEITNVYHTGDITDGLKMRPGHEYVDENGYIQRIIPEFIPFYVSEKDDYKKFK